MDKLLDLAVEAARLAGSAILTHYRQALAVEHKQDGSPLTLADQAAHRVIVSHLASSSLVVVSEEGEDLHLDAERYWLVDPLDGTKDFLAGNGEFTVNIALVDAGRPVLGVVFAPAIDDLYWGTSAWALGVSGTVFQRHYCLKPNHQPAGWRSVVSMIIRMLMYLPPTTESTSVWP